MLFPSIHLCRAQVFLDGLLQLPKVALMAARSHRIAGIDVVKVTLCLAFVYSAFQGTIVGRFSLPPSFAFMLFADDAGRLGVISRDDI
jgi:hypothetical protein